jgi:hypothetical protein
MGHLFFLVLFFLFLVPGVRGAQAQVFSDTPLCLILNNTTGAEVLGHIETAEHRDANGKLSWHRSNFRLAAGTEQEVCATGPFFDGYKLRLVLKTLIPLYSCKTEMNRTVNIMRVRDSNGIENLVADCPSEKS